MLIITSQICLVRNTTAKNEGLTIDVFFSPLRGSYQEMRLQGGWRLSTLKLH